MTTTYEVLVIGAGPAGLTAARVIAEGGVNCAIVDKMGPGGQLMNMGEIHDCPEVDAGTTGPDLIEKLVEPVLTAGVELLIDEVGSAEYAGAWTIAMLDQTVSAKALVIATGLTNGTTGLPQEVEFEGRGISHCAICDGPLYAGKRVVVAGSDHWAIQEALDLTAVTGHVTLIADTVELDATPTQKRLLQEAANFAVLNGQITGLIGTGALEQVTVETLTGKRQIPSTGLFLFTNRRGATEFLTASAVTGENGLVTTDSEGQTSINSLFVCGDARMGGMQRVASAIADGRRAGQNALRWLQSSASD